MSLRKIAEKYYRQDYNCAESILRAANEYYDLHIQEKDFAMIGGFGGGMYTEAVCGVVTGGIAAIGKQQITAKARETTDLKATVIRYMQKFEEELGATNCKVLKRKYKTQCQGCLQTVLKGADVLALVMKKRS